MFRPSLLRSFWAKTAVWIGQQQRHRAPENSGLEPQQLDGLGQWFAPFPKGPLIQVIVIHWYFWVVWLYHSSLNRMGVELISTFGSRFFKVLQLLPRSWLMEVSVSSLSWFTQKKRQGCLLPLLVEVMGFKQVQLKGMFPFKVFPVLPGNSQGAILCDIKIYFLGGI